jgi:hypothetical protein
MQKHRQELLRSVTRRIQRGRKTTGRFVASALGFGVAYYFDAANGGSRRNQLHGALRHLFRQVNGTLAPDVADLPAFPPVLVAHSASRPPAPRVGARP